MIGDYRSKPTQGSLFTYQRNYIQGISEKDFQVYKKWCKLVLVKCNLCEDLENNIGDT